MKQGAPETETTTTPIMSQEEKVEVNYDQLLIISNNLQSKPQLIDPFIFSFSTKCLLIRAISLRINRNHLQISRKKSLKKSP